MLLQDNIQELREYVLAKFKAEGDFAFLKDGEIEHMVDNLVRLDAEFMERTGAIEGEVYDDDDAYDFLCTAMKQMYPDYQIYCLRLSEDYLDFSEEYLESIDAIDWD